MTQPAADLAAADLAAADLAAADLSVVPATPARLGSLAELFGTSKTTSSCYCMWFVVSARECQEGWSGANRHSFEELARASPEPVGVLAYAGERPVGWCAVGPRARYQRALRSSTLKARDLSEDASTWLVPCFYVLRQARRSGVTRALLETAVATAARHGARAVEGFPLAGEGRHSAASAYVGVEPLFASCGFTVIARPSPSRVVMRRELTPTGSPDAGSGSPSAVSRRRRSGRGKGAPTDR